MEDYILWKDYEKDGCYQIIDGERCGGRTDAGACSISGHGRSNFSCGKCKQRIVIYADEKAVIRRLKSLKRMELQSLFKQYPKMGTLSFWSSYIDDINKLYIMMFSIKVDTGFEKKFIRISMLCNNYYDRLNIISKLKVKIKDIIVYDSKRNTVFEADFMDEYGELYSKKTTDQLQ